MRCPKCESRGIMYVSRYSVRGYKEKRYTCKECRHKYATAEFYKEDGVLKKLGIHNQIKKLFGESDD